MARWRATLGYASTSRGDVWRMSSILRQRKLAAMIHPCVHAHADPLPGWRSAWLAVLLGLISLLAACAPVASSRASEGVATASAESANVYRDPKLGFSLALPAGWSATSYPGSRGSASTTAVVVRDPAQPAALIVLGVTHSASNALSLRRPRRARAAYRVVSGVSRRHLAAARPRPLRRADSARGPGLRARRLVRDERHRLYKPVGTAPRHVSARACRLRRARIAHNSASANLRGYAADRRLFGDAQLGTQPRRARCHLALRRLGRARARGVCLQQHRLQRSVPVPMHGVGQPLRSRRLRSGAHSRQRRALLRLLPGRRIASWRRARSAVRDVRPRRRLQPRAQRIRAAPRRPAGLPGCRQSARRVDLRADQLSRPCRADHGGRREPCLRRPGELQRPPLLPRAAVDIKCQRLPHHRRQRHLQSHRAWLDSY